MSELFQEFRKIFEILGTRDNEIGIFPVTRNDTICYTHNSKIMRRKLQETDYLLTRDGANCLGNSVLMDTHMAEKYRRKDEKGNPKYETSKTNEKYLILEEIYLIYLPKYYHFLQVFFEFTRKRIVLSKKGKFQPICMEPLASKSILLKNFNVCFGISINFVSENGESDRGEMNADLMGSTCEEVYF